MDITVPTNSYPISKILSTEPKKLKDKRNTNFTRRNSIDVPLSTSLRSTNDMLAISPTSDDEKIPKSRRHSLTSIGSRKHIDTHSLFKQKTALPNGLSCIDDNPVRSTGARKHTRKSLNTPGKIDLSSFMARNNSVGDEQSATPTMKAKKKFNTLNHFASSSDGKKSKAGAIVPSHHQRYYLASSSKKSNFNKFGSPYGTKTFLDSQSLHTSDEKSVTSIGSSSYHSATSLRVFG